MSYLGVDTDKTVTQAIAEGWSRAQVQAVGRYLRNLQACEVLTLHHAGLKVWAIYETNPTQDAYFTAAQGTSDARTALEQAKAVDIPSNCPIFFAVDYVPDASHAAAIISYFEAIQATFEAEDRSVCVGVYGSYPVMWWCWNTPALNNKIRYWQTAGNGSCGYVFPYADAVQIPSTCGNEPTLNGCAVDFDLVLNPDIAW